MPNKVRLYQCEDCGTWTRRKRKSNDPMICVPCGRDRMVYGGAMRRRRTQVTRRPDDPPATCTQ